eukprot:Phypoly_transcript_06832.p1 GENE.Phypoly_transcript_06832~~Phypoly_transcript_06832.p1  ORF type:complete len:330 (+),score=43.28 Phypoly_transcript_06832:305-1294(+)
MLHLAKNMLCSLARIDPALITRLTIWAMNEDVVGELHDWNSKNEQFFNLAANQPQNTKPATYDTVNSTTKNNTVLPVHGFSVFYDTNYIGAKEMVDGWKPGYKDMMFMRKSLYADIVQNLNLLFMDGDMVFLEDPYQDMGITDDFSNYSDLASNEYFWQPDFVYATDARDHYKWLEDPYEKMPYVPMICGCLFYARANNRTARIMNDLAKLDYNDQFGIDVLFNSPGGQCTILSEPLPSGLPRRDHDRKDCVPEDRLRVQILDLGKYANGVLFLKRKDHYQEVLREMEEKGEKRVMVHPNIWEYNFDKVKALKDEGFWFLDEDEMCQAR